MILQALYDHYRTMQKLPVGFTMKEIPFVIVIEEDGTYVRLEGFSPDKKNPAREFEIPTPVTRTSAVAPNLFWDHYGYVLGLSKKEGEKEEVKAKRQMDAFRTMVDNFVKAYPENVAFAAVKAFYDREEYLKITEDADLISEITKKAGNNMSFCLASTMKAGELIAHDPDLIDYQRRNYFDSKSEEGAKEAVCLITGEKGPIARLHPGISLGGMPLSLVNFQINSGYDSYGKSQALNAPVSPEAAEGYAMALNDLLRKDTPTNYFLSGVTYVFWSGGGDYKLVEDFRMATFDPPMRTVEVEEEKLSKRDQKRKARKAKTAQILDTEKSKKVVDALRAVTGGKGAYIDTDAKERFYLIGLEPGRGRISVKLFVEGTVSEIVGHTLQHLEDMKIVGRYCQVETDRPPVRSIYGLLASVFPKALKSNTWPKRPIDGLVRSITTGIPYPGDLFAACIQRNQADKQVTELRAAFIKAYLNREYRYKNHTTDNPITMALNKEQTNKGYLAGRLFAVLEHIQKSANGKATITDSYFAAASTTPGSTLPGLISLSSHHLEKIRKGSNPGFASKDEERIKEIMNLFDGSESPFPVRFDLEDQGYFDLGYYHQKTEIYTKDEGKTID